MSIQVAPGGRCIVVHLGDDTEVHFRDPDHAQDYAETLPASIHVRAIETAQTPCWTANCDQPGCLGVEGDENGDPTHVPGRNIAEAEQRLTDLQRVPTGALLCSECRDQATNP